MGVQDNLAQRIEKGTADDIHQLTDGRGGRPGVTDPETVHCQGRREFPNV
jgi:hypothetical protein